MSPTPSRRRPYGLAIALAVSSVVLAVVVALVLDLPIRDPDGVAGPAYVRLPLIVFVFFVADVVPRALHRARGIRGAGTALSDVIRERWTARRTVLVAVGMASFYATYVAYRNLKSALPFVRDRLYDAALLDLDRALFLGNDPSTVLHTVLGTGVSAHVLSFVYLLFLAFVPLSLGAALVWARNVRTGAYYATALCLNWLLGTASYYLLPSLGPVFVRPRLFAGLPETGVSALQESLLEARLEVLGDPIGASAIQGIAGFASLHVSIVFTGALVVHKLGLHRVLRWSMWLFLVLTVLATVYFGWHYLVDDVAGLAIGAGAVWLAGHATGYTRARREQAQGVPATTEPPALPRAGSAGRS